jgi:hypothetical protein
MCIQSYRTLLDNLRGFVDQSPSEHVFETNTCLKTPSITKSENQLKLLLIEISEVSAYLYMPKLATDASMTVSMAV